MTPPQLNLYRREWGNVRRILRTTMSPDQADAERHALHVKALGEDKSSILFTNDDFDKVLKEFRAISQPANARTQIALEAMPATRLRVYIGHILAALGEEEGYAESIIARMQKGRKQRSTGAASMATLDTLTPGALDKVKIALKIECRRRWPTKDHLLGEIHTMRLDNDFHEAPTTAAIMLALNVRTLRPFHKLYYEPLLIVLATLRRLAYGQIPFPVVTDQSSAALTHTRGDADAAG